MSPWSNGRSRESRAGSESGNQPHRKRPNACVRCRRRKVRCGGEHPTCSNCAKAGVRCEKTVPSQVELLERIHHLESLMGNSNQLLSTAPVTRTEQTSNPTDWNVLDVPSTNRHDSELPAVQYNPDSFASPSHPDTRRTEPALVSITPQLNLLPEREETAFVELGYPARVPDSPNPPREEHVSPTSHQAHVTAFSPGSVATVGRQQPIAHEVGMLSLANSADPKYLGPSSGVLFARLLYAAAPQTQGLSGNTSSIPPQQSRQPVTPASLPGSKDIRRFVNVYFTTLHPFYPFLDHAAFLTTAEAVRRASQGTRPKQNVVVNRQDAAQLYLVIFLGARILESRTTCSLDAEGYLSTAMIHVAESTLHDSLQGLQILLLLILSSLHSPNGLNAWFLRSSLLAGCIDLGIHRRTDYESPSSLDSIKHHDVRSGVFWSAYSLDRTLSVVLGRPLTLRDEALDIGFPGDLTGDEIQRDATNLYTDGSEPPEKRRRLASPKPASFSFRFDRIIAEIKLTLHRVCQSPARFPWPQNFEHWQADVHKACSRLLDEMYNELDRIDVSESSVESVIPLLELKYHHIMMLLYRPSPSIPRPSVLALRFCFESAMETIRIYSELHRTLSLTNSWLDAHTIFIAGITICYSLWMSPQIRQVTPAKLFIYYVNMTKRLLEAMAQTWSVAASACSKFEALAEWARETFQGDMMADEDARRLPTPQIDNAQDAPNIATIPFDDDIDWAAMTIDYDNAALLPDEFQEVPDWFALEGWLKEN